MSSVRIELNSAGVRELLKSAEMQSIVGELAEGIATKAGSGYGSDTHMAGTRVIASAFTDSPEAMRDTLKNNTLLKAMR